MRIGIDLRCLEEEKISGVGEYALEIVKNLLEIDRKNKYIIFSNSWKQRSKNFDFLKKYSRVELKRFRYPNRILNFFLWYFDWPKIDRLIGGVDIFFAPNINFLAVSKKCPLVATFHDLSFERFTEFFGIKTRLWHYYFVNPRRLVKKLKQVIAVSQSTKNDLEELYKINKEKISIIYHGVSEDYKVISRNDPKLLAVQRKYHLPYKFILYLGNIEPRKNVSSLIKAYKELKKEGLAFKEYKLILAGKVSPLCYNIVGKEKDNIILIGYVNRVDKPFIYNLASLFVYPSFFEGFGMPVLEAMACGTPVITSNTSSLPEVAGKAALMIDPHRPQELLEAMKSILLDKKLYNTLRERGLKQSQNFSWKKSAKETLQIFENLKNRI